MNLFIVLGAASAVLAGCAADLPEPAPIEVSWDDLNELVEAFGYEQGIRRFCEDPSADSQDKFLQELDTLAGVDAALVARAKARASEVQSEFDSADPDEEQEYVCTVEMYAGSEDRADAARQVWANIKEAGK